MFRSAIWLALTLVSLSGADVTSAQDLVLSNATVIDGTGAPPRTGVSIIIRDGKIAEIEDGARTGDTTIDLKGRFVRPGLIDAHTHILSADAAESALLSGVTTARVPGDR